MTASCQPGIERNAATSAVGESALRSTHALPDWFVTARDKAGGRYGSVMYDDCRIAYQTWGRAGQPALLLIHGAGASSEWWEATAILLADSFHIVAPSFAGCGRSQWRESYRMDQAVAEALACADAEFGSDNPTRPACVAHSFGSEAGVRLAIDPARPISQLVLVDSLMGLYESPDSSFPRRERLFYPSTEDAVRRFSTVPRDAFGPQSLRDHVALQSLEATTSPQGNSSWSWRADPNVMAGMDCPPVFDRIGDACCPIDIVYGGRSSMNSADLRASQVSRIMQHCELIGIDESGHHILLDRPIELSNAIRRLVGLRSQGGSVP